MLLNRCVTLWVGDSLGPVERACLRSIARHGHSVWLYCYDEPEGVPEEVEIHDASEVLARDLAMAPWCARADLYSDWFRYEMLGKGLGTWVDTDLYLVAPLDMEAPNLFGVQDPGGPKFAKHGHHLNNAVLRLPPDSPLLPKLLEPFHNRTTPSWLAWRDYLPMRLREFVVGKADLMRLGWGATSPLALSVLATQFGIAGEAQPQEVFYPVPWEEAEWIRDPAIALEDAIAPNTVAIHLWNRCIESFKNEPAPPGSFLHRLQEEGRL